VYGTKLWHHPGGGCASGAKQRCRLDRSRG
jgi:hypothetical protein